MPKRIQRRRTKGWRMPPNTVYVGRPTKYGNRFTGKNAVKEYEAFLILHPKIADEFRKELRGKDLACWCSLDKPCHADVLLEIANDIDRIKISLNNDISLRRNNGHYEN